MIQENELVTLVFAALAMGILVPLTRRLRLPGSMQLLTAMAVLVFAYVCTVLEGLFYVDLFNLLEHLSYLAAGIMFASFMRRGLQADTADEDPPP